LISYSYLLFVIENTLFAYIGDEGVYKLTWSVGKNGTNICETVINSSLSAVGYAEPL